jgi:hypothetical protein
MFDTSRFTTTITGDTAVIGYQAIGGRATIDTLIQRSASIPEIVSHNLGINELGADWLEITVSGSDINNIVNQAIVVLAG